MFQKYLIRFGWLILFLTGAGMAFLFFQLTGTIDRSNLTVESLLYYLAALGLYWLIIWYIRSFWGKSYLSLEAIVLFAVFFRLIFLFHDPLFDDSAYRYSWDGKVFNAGIHPYEITPSSDRLRGFQDDVIYPKVAGQNHPSQSSPLSLMLFRLIGLITDSPFVFRVIMLLFDLITILILISLLRYMERATAWVIVYAWNPLLIIESASHGQDMMFVVLLFAIGLSFAFRCRSLYSAVFIGLASSVHWIILAVVPFIEDVRSRWKTWTGVALIVGGIWMILFHTPDFLPESIINYLSSVYWEQENNSSLYAGIQYLYELFMTDADSIAESTRLTAAVLFLITLIAALFIYWKKNYLSQKQNMIRFVYIIMTTAFIIYPVLVPSGILIMLPVLCFYPGPAWIVFSGLIGLYYFNSMEWLSGGSWYQSLRLFEYTPFYLLFFLSILLHFIKKRKEFYLPEKHP